MTTRTAHIPAARFAQIGYENWKMMMMMNNSNKYDNNDDNDNDAAA